MNRFLHLGLGLALAGAAASGQTAAQIEFFEKKVRPVLAANCQACHNAKTRTAHLDMSSATGFVSGGISGPLVSAEDPGSSRLLRVVSYEENLKMPPMRKLSDEEIENLTAWVKMGAPWPGAEQAKAQPSAPKYESGITSAHREFWAFQPVKPHTPPPTGNRAWVNSEVDAFILAKLEEKGLKPAPPADKYALLRRATFDLTGLPPSEQEIRDFIADTSPDAFRKVVDRLLASPRYGERWGRHWLDVARYADSTGNDEDHRYPYAWRYRDYVIDAFNRDLPYNQFIREQVAGDLLPAPGGKVNRSGIVATGFLALGAKAIAQQDKTKMLYDVYDEQVDVTTKAFLGLTVSCARCHNHKFDPILTRDYYSLVSMFASTRSFETPETHVSKLLYVPLVPKEEFERHKAGMEKARRVQTYVDDLNDRELERHARNLTARIAAYMLAARKVSGEKAPAAQVAKEHGLDVELLNRWVKYLEPAPKGRGFLVAWYNASPEQQPRIAQEFQQSFEESLEEWSKALKQWREDAGESLRNPDLPAPPARPRLEGAKHRFFNDAFVKAGGPFTIPEGRRQNLYPPDVLQTIARLKNEIKSIKAAAGPEPDMACAVTEGRPVEQKVFIRGDYGNPGEPAPKAFPTVLARPGDPEINAGSGRLQLADWLANPRNPLTARVMVNRIWHWHFGEGLVRTPDNFGKMGGRPSHPELLDYLARKFIQSGWSVKAMHRLVMLSNAYGMSTEANPKSLEADPENLLLSRFNRQRLSVEQIRDGLLAIDGSLDPTMGGTLQTGFGTDGENSAGRLSLDPATVKRRTVYLPLRRANLPTLLNLFDFGDATTVNGKRIQTNVAPQALFMMNSDFVSERSQNLADSLMKLQDAGGRQRLETAYLRTLSRKPAAAEVDASLTYIGSFSKKFAGQFSEADAWRSLCRILIASNEFVYLD